MGCSERAGSTLLRRPPKVYHSELKKLLSIFFSNGIPTLQYKTVAKLWHEQQASKNPRSLENRGADSLFLSLFWFKS
jgi:hypothetical protein